MALGAATVREITALRDRYPQARSAILPCLWAVQNELGYLSIEGMAEVASILDLAPSEVQAVSTFYSMYFNRPEGDHQVLICINVSCGLRGADAIVEHVERRLGCPSGGTTADGLFTWESTVECLGACGGAPAMQIDHHFHEDLTEDRVDAILERLRTAPRPSHGNGHAPSRRQPAVEPPPAAAGMEPPPAPGPEPIAEPDEPAAARPKRVSKPRASRSTPRKRPRLDASDL
ncbi:MAG: NAD(P)H-dependent oxidoreductase subunit E [Candidatus Dormibacter sp.]